MKKEIMKKTSQLGPLFIRPHVAVNAAPVAADLEGVDVHPLGSVVLDDLEVNSIALLNSQQTFQQSFYSSVGHPVVLETLLKSLLRFQQSY